jgi:hypothetical protein
MHNAGTSFCGCCLRLVTLVQTAGLLLSVTFRRPKRQTPARRRKERALFSLSRENRDAVFESENGFVQLIPSNAFRK